MTQQGNTHSPERRAFTRIRREFVAKVMERGRWNLPAGELAGKNISVAGIGIETHRHYPVGSTLVLELLLAAPEGGDSAEPPRRRGAFHVQCQVIWSDYRGGGRFATGLRFVNLDAKQLKALSQLIAEESQ